MLLAIGHRAEEDDERADHRPLDEDIGRRGDVECDAAEANPADDPARTRFAARHAPDKADDQLVAVERMHRDQGQKADGDVQKQPYWSGRGMGRATQKTSPRAKVKEASGPPSATRACSRPFRYAPSN